MKNIDLLKEFIKINYILNESRIDDVKAKFPQYSDDTIDSIAKTDQTGTQKYLFWIVKNLESSKWPADKIIELTQKFGQSPTA